MPDLDASTLIVTREKSGAAKSVARLSSFGFKAVSCPAIEITPLAIGALSEPPKAVIFSSQNGVRYAPESLLHSVSITFCVGDATANAARKAGYSNVISAAGNASDLLKLILEEWAPERGTIVHVGHEAPRGDIVQLLSQEGFEAELMPVYSSTIRTGFEAECLDHLDTKSVIFLIYSPLAAEALNKVLEKFPLSGHTECPLFCVISPETRKKLKNLPDRLVRIASKPNENSLLEALRAP